MVKGVFEDDEEKKAGPGATYKATNGKKKT
jgi:hypothetical protein